MVSMERRQVRVQLFLGKTLIGDRSVPDKSSEQRFQFGHLPAGTYIVTAKALYKGETYVSKPVTFTVHKVT